jgi:hypothetical protein
MRSQASVGDGIAVHGGPVGQRPGQRPLVAADREHETAWRIQFRCRIAPSVDFIVVAPDDHNLRVRQVFFQRRQQRHVAVRVFIHRAPGGPQRALGGVEIAGVSQEEA